MRDHSWWPPGMSEREFQFLRGINAAIELTRESGYDSDRRLGNTLMMRYPQVKAIRDDGVRSAGIVAVTTCYRDGVVMYRPPGMAGMAGPSDCDWRVPTR